MLLNNHILLFSMAENLRYELEQSYYNRSLPKCKRALKLNKFSMSAKIILKLL